MNSDCLILFTGQFRPCSTVDPELRRCQCCLSGLNLVTSYIFMKHTKLLNNCSEALDFYRQMLLYLIFLSFRQARGHVPVLSDKNFYPIKKKRKFLSKSFDQVVDKIYLEDLAF